MSLEMVGGVGGAMTSDPIALEMNVDAALVLQSLVGIDSYPDVLALLPNIYDPKDRDWVHAVVRDRLAEAGVLEGDRVHPRVAHWLQCLYRPDVELVARIIDIGVDPDSGQRRPAAMLRLSLVRSGETHVLAVRCDDDVVVQELFTAGRPLRTVAAAVASALGPAEPLRFDPITVPAAQLDELATEPAEEVEQALIELGADGRAASVLVRELSTATRRAEVVAVEHHDGGDTQTRVCVNLFDAPLGRVVATPSVGVDDQAWVTYSPGDRAAIEAAMTALVHLLPNASWTDTDRSR
jgi:hypothetical protein